MKLRRLLCFSAILIATTVIFAGPAMAQVEVPGKCIIGKAGVGEKAAIVVNGCAGTSPSPCTVKAVAFIQGGPLQVGRDVSAEGSCGSHTAHAEAEVPIGGGKDSDTDGPVGPGSPMSGCSVDTAAGLTFWYAYCEFTFVAE